MGANLHRLNDFVLTICFGSKQRRAKKRNIAESDFLMQLALLQAANLQAANFE